MYLEGWVSVGEGVGVDDCRRMGGCMGVGLDVRAWVGVCERVGVGGRVCALRACARAIRPRPRIHALERNNPSHNRE